MGVWDWLHDRETPGPCASCGASWHSCGTGWLVCCGSCHHWQAYSKPEDRSASRKGRDR